jgi:AcrR family transcriptional regulator
MEVSVDNSGAGKRRRGRPPKITREAALAAALRILDADGLSALTMRRLGADLGVDPMTIYHHLPDKAALFDGLVGEIYAEIEIPERTGDWAADLRRLADVARATFLAHPEALPLLSTRPPVTESAFRLVETVTAILLDAGFSPQRAMDGFDCIGRLVIGHTLAEGGQVQDLGANRVNDDHAAAQSELSLDDYPAIAAVERAGVEHDPDRLFDLAFRGLLIALGDEQAASAPAAD